MRKNQTTRTTLAPSSPSSPSLPSSPLSLSSPSSSSSPQKSPTSSPRKNKPMLGLGFGGVPYRASIPICELKVPNERERRDVGGSVMGGGGGAAGVENDKTAVSLNSSSSNNNNQEPDTPSTNSPQTPTDISEPFSYHGDLGSGKTRTRTAAVAAFDSAATMRNLNLKNSDKNKNNTDEFEEDDHNDNDHNNNTNNNNNNNDHHHDNPNPSLFNPNQIPKPTFRDLEEPYGGTKHFMMAHGLKCKFPFILQHVLTHSFVYVECLMLLLIRFFRVRFHRLCNPRENFGAIEGYGVAESGE